MVWWAVGKRADEARDVPEKVRLYVSAIEFAMGALEGAEDGREAAAMRAHIRALLRKAEGIRDQLRSSLSDGFSPAFLGQSARVNRSGQGEEAAGTKSRAEFGSASGQGRCDRCLHFPCSHLTPATRSGAAHAAVGRCSGGFFLASCQLDTWKLGVHLGEGGGDGGGEGAAVGE